MTLNEKSEIELPPGVRMEPGLYYELDDRLVGFADWVKDTPEKTIDPNNIPRVNGNGIALSVMPMETPFPKPKDISELNKFCDQLTPDQKQEEFIKCKINPAYFMSTYCWIRHPVKGVIQFDLFDYQRFKVLPTFINQRFMITRKFRQGGFSTVGAGFSLWSARFERNKEILLISKSDREALNMMSMVITMWDNLPSFLQCKTIGKGKKRTLALETGGKISAFTPKAGRSFGLSTLIIDEAAFIPGMEDIWADVFPTVSTGGQVFVISTVNGVGNWYHEYYEYARPGPDSNGFVRVDVKYDERPDYDEKWAKDMKAQLGERRFRQEILAEFMGSSETYLPHNSVQYLINSTNETPPIRMAPMPVGNGQEIKDCFRFWKDVEPGKEYVIGVDVGGGGGDNADNSAAVVIDIASIEQVAEFACNKVSPDNFAKILSALGNYYNVATVAVESNVFGQHVLKTLVEDISYENVYWESIVRPGIQITEKNRLVLLEQLMRAVMLKRFGIKSRWLASEWQSFLWNSRKNRPEHAPKFKDDLIFASAHALHVREYLVRGLSAFETPGEETARPLFEYTQSEEKSLTDIVTGKIHYEDDILMPMSSLDFNDNDDVNNFF